MSKNKSLVEQEKVTDKLKQIQSKITDTITLNNTTSFINAKEAIDQLYINFEKYLILKKLDSVLLPYTV